MEVEPDSGGYAEQLVRVGYAAPSLRGPAQNPPCCVLPESCVLYPGSFGNNNPKSLRHTEIAEINHRSALSRGLRMPVENPGE